MDISQFLAGKWQKAYKYKYFLPENINHSWNINDIKIQKKLESVSLKL